LSHINEQTAAVVMETVQAESGINLPTPGYLQAVRNRCNEVGALLILDEIQVGYGRTGTLWAFEQQGVVPDILLLAKGMGGGMPIGAFVASHSMMQTLTDNPLLGHITTFGGHPVCVAAALATLQTLLEENYISKANEKELLFRILLVHPEIKAVRGKGLFLGVELRDFDFLQRVIQYCISKGVITDWFLFNDKTMRIAPPLIITEGEIRNACAIILEALDCA
jgi:acetylornithine/succinyldiaminopimelate/putrescine aminotransferase